MMEWVPSFSIWQTQKMNVMVLVKWLMLLNATLRNYHYKVQSVQAPEQQGAPRKNSRLQCHGECQFQPFMKSDCAECTS